VRPALGSCRLDGLGRRKTELGEAPCLRAEHEVWKTGSSGRPARCGRASRVLWLSHDVLGDLALSGPDLPALRPPARVGPRGPRPVDRGRRRVAARSDRTR
jgi:hypothetical protein